MKFYLFTDIDKLLNQTSGKEFGAISDYSSDSEKFQISSVHNCETNSKAYAITDGLIIVQPNQDDATLVNVLLKPTKQCIENAPIEYFIYRGIKKSSLFDSSLIKSSGNDLCDLINNTIIRLNQKYPINVHSPEEYILAYGDIADLDFLSNTYPILTTPGDIFVDTILNTTNLKYKPFKINGGAYIGDLNAEFGIDVVLAKAKIKLSDVRKSTNFIISKKLAQITDEQFINSKYEREMILHYFDICQFYSIAYQKTGIWWKSSSENTFNKSKNDNQITTILDKFFNKTILFLDIRNEFNDSLNYQNNIAGTLGIKKDNSTYSYLPFPDWPILKINIQSITTLRIRIPKSDFTGVRAYFRETNKDSYSFKAINFDSSNYSTELKISTVKSPSGVTLPTYMYFMFLREIDEDSYPSEWVILPYYFIDTLFDIEDLIYTDANENLYMYGLTYYQKATKWKIYEENKYIDLDKQSYIGKIGVAEDNNNIYFFGFSNGDSLQLGGVDIPIVTGESDKANFLEDILFPKLNNTISIYSYKITQGGEDVYVLKDNINDIKPNNSLKLVQSKNNFVLIALDKQESLDKLKNAYLQFANNLPKKMVIRNIKEVNEVGAKKHLEADITIIGYGNDTSTNSYKVKEINTGIKLIYANKMQRIIGTNRFNERYLKSTIQINAENFFGKMHQHIRYNFRTLPDYAPGSSVKFAGGRRDIYFKVLGKCLSPNNDVTWYFVELLEDELDFDNPNIKGQKGYRYFISEESSPVITAKFDAFIEEFTHQNSVFDNATNGSQNDALEQRITRYRQRGHKSNVDLFNEVIGSTVSNPIYLDQIPYESDELITIQAETGTFPESVGFEITNRLQLYRDFENVQFSNGKTAEIQHMFVGLDVIGNLREDFYVTYYGIPIHILNNVHFSLYAGDAGTVPNPVFNCIDNDSGNQEAVKEAIDIKFNQDTPNNRSLNPINNRYFQHYLNTRFALYDRYGNLYAFGLYYQLFQNIWIYEPPNPSASFQLEALFDSFNNDMSSSESDSVRFFYDFFKCDLTKSISSTTNILLYNEIRESTVDFSIVWRKLEQGTLIVLPSTIEVLEKYSHLAIQEHINLINLIRKKNL